MAFEAWEVTRPDGTTGAVLVSRTTEEVFGQVWESKEMAECFLAYVHDHRYTHLANISRNDLRNYAGKFSEFEKVQRCECCDRLHWDTVQYRDDLLCVDCYDNALEAEEVC